MEEEEARKVKMEKVKEGMRMWGERERGEVQGKESQGGYEKH